MGYQITGMPTVLLTASALLLSSISGDTKQRAPSLAGATGWLNTEPLNLSRLRGKVVLIDFWTYTCINWRRTLPYIREWAVKYKDQGLVVIGVHTPEFSFEKKLSNIKDAIKEMNIIYPVAVDDNYEIWDSFRNNYWPAIYLVDAKGKIRYQKFGEGEYSEFEKEIQRLLKESSPSLIFPEPVPIHGHGYEADPDWQNLKSPETYLNYNHTQGFASPEGAEADEQTLYSLPRRLRLNQWALSGEWTLRKESLLLSKGKGKIVYRFHARDLHLVMGPDKPGGSTKFRILIDGKPPGAAHGLDVDSSGNGTITGQRMYHLIRQQAPITGHEFEIEFFSPDVEVYVFTFG